MRALPASVVLALACLAPPLLASAPAEPPKPAEGDARRAAIQGQLRHGDWAPALAAVQGEIDRALQPGEGALPLADLAAWKAVAEAGLGREEEAVWDWQVAQNLAHGWPMDSAELASYGAPGRLLGTRILRKLGEAPAGVEVRGATVSGATAGAVASPSGTGSAASGGAAGVLEKPRLVSGTPPAFPAALRGRSVPKWLAAEIVVDAQGRPRDPVVVAGRLPEMTYAVLAAARNWKFTPAKEGGKPVATFYLLAANGPAGKPLEQLVRLEDDSLKKLAELLHARRWEEAEARGRARWNRVLDDNEQGATYLGVLLALRAVAEAGLGREGRAICRWNAAQTLEPLLFHAGLAAYGPPGELLEKNRWGAYPFEAEIAAAAPPRDGKFEPAKELERAEPRYPSYLAQTTAEGTAVYTMIIDPAGTVREAEVARTSGWHDMDASGLDAVCDSRFAPGSLGGKAIPTRYQYTLQFYIRKVP